MRPTLLFVILLLTLLGASANQQEEALSDSVRTDMHGQVSDRGVDQLLFTSIAEQEQWLQDNSRRLLRIIPAHSILQNDKIRRDFLTAVRYESLRAGLSTQLVLAIIHVESAFRKYAISVAGARGYMQVMPFWQGVIGEGSHNLFSLRTNLRYGTVILRHYLDQENGNLARALGRYNGSLGKMKYPNLVFSKQEKYWL